MEILPVVDFGWSPCGITYPTYPTYPGITGSAADMYRGFSAPYKILPDEGYNGMRRFPLSIPLDMVEQIWGAPRLPV